MKSQQAIITLTLAIYLTGCQTSSPTRGLESTSAPQFTHPVPDIWADVRVKMETLEQTGAPLSQWKEAAGSSEQVPSILRLHEITQPLQTDSDARKNQLEQMFSGASVTYHFGFDGNFHALVFFDASHRPLKFVKW